MHYCEQIRNFISRASLLLIFLLWLQSDIEKIFFTPKFELDFDYMSLSSEYQFEFDFEKNGPHETAVTHPSINPARPSLTLENTRRNMNKDILFCLPLLLPSVCGMAY